MQRVAGPPATDPVLRAALGLLLLGVAVGAALRVGQVTPLPWLHVGHATHTHSHTLYFGWAGVALFALFFERLAVPGRLAGAVSWALVATGLATFGVFLRFGYETPGVVVAAASLGPFGAAVATTLWHARRARGADVGYLQAAAGWVLVSYVAAMGRVVVKVLRVEDPVWAALAVHGFLGAFGAFFVLGVLGLTLRAVGERLPAPRWVLRLAAPLLGFPALLTVPGLEATPLFGLSRAAAVLLLLPAAAWGRWLFAATAPRPSLERWVLRSSALAWALHTGVYALLALGVASELVLQRHAVVLGIHLLVVGVVTAGLLALLELRRAAPDFRALAAHQGALGVMLLGLGAAVASPGRGPLAVAAVGGALLVLAQAWAALRFVASAAVSPRARPVVALAALVLLGPGCAPPTPPPPPPPVHEAPAALRACVAAAFGPVPTILSAIDRLNALPRPVDVPCFVASLGRPLSVVATTSVISAQPAAGLQSPRLFLLSETLALSVVPDGNGAPLIEFGEWVSPTRTLKGELELPVTEALPLDAAFTHVKYSETLTTCALCHREETPHPTLPGAYVSEAYRPAPRSLVALSALVAEHQACIEAGDESARCALYHALFDFGAVEPGAFDARVSTFP